MLMRYSRGKSYSLIELIVVIVIIGILAGIAIPSYYRAREAALGKEAIANLKLITAAVRNYHLKYSSYPECDCDTLSCDCNTILMLHLDPRNWTYEVDNSIPPCPAGEDFCISATRPDNSCFYTYNQSSAAPVKDVSCPAHYP